MGKTIVSCIHDTPGAAVCGGTESAGSPAAGKDIGDIAGIGPLQVSIASDLAEVIGDCDTLIDFSSPESSLATLDLAARNNKPIVVGTTGFSPAQRETIAGIARRIPCVVAPNMSIGVNVLFKMVREMARALGDAYDVEIVEAHHKFKKDAPSGTAVRISEIVAEALERDLKEVGIYGRKGFAERSPKEIGIHTLRAGDIVGEHRVVFGGMGETLEIFHRAQSRETFARGAVRAALWVVDKTPGLYDMQDVLGLKD